jgi:hypothetical protein
VARRLVIMAVVGGWIKQLATYCASCRVGRELVVEIDGGGTHSFTVAILSA